jgi:hypothetical protein
VAGVLRELDCCELATRAELAAFDAQTGTQFSLCAFQRPGDADQFPRRAAISPARSRGSPSIDSSTAARTAGGSAEAAGRKLDEFDAAGGDCANTFIFQPSLSWHASPELEWPPVSENVRQ